MRESPISTRLGCMPTASFTEVRILADIGRQDPMLTPDEKVRIEQVFQPHAERLAFYRGVV